MSEKTQYRIQALLRNWLADSSNSEQEKELNNVAKEDLFLSDSMDGFRQNRGKHSQCMGRLQAKLDARTGKEKDNIAFLSIQRFAAAAAILFLGMVGIWYLNDFNIGNKSVADNIQMTKETSTPIVKENSKETKDFTDVNDSTIVEENAEKPKPTKEAIQKTKPKTKRVEKIKEIPKELPPNSIPPTSNDRGTIPMTTIPPSDAMDVESEPIVEEIPEEYKTIEISEADAIVYPEQAPVVYSDASATAEQEEAEVITAPYIPPENESAASMTIETNIFGGTVVDENGEPLIGVTILEANTNNGVLTDLDGNFEIVPTNPQNTLLITYTGYQDQFFTPELAINNTITMIGAAVLSEVVVTDISKKKEASSAYTETIIDVFPTDGYEKYMDYINQNMLYPISAAENSIEGQVVLEFKVYEDGRPQEVKVAKSLGFGCDEEAVRLLEQGPNWQTEKKGKPTNFTVKFKLKKKE